MIPDEFITTSGTVQEIDFASSSPNYELIVAKTHFYEFGFLLLAFALFISITYFFKNIITTK